ncbi:hypothetical protein EDB19DRAFT_1927409 [Suillus lakei]|nr:hypothetical protein EDB19DRAFT_1927409 [Suillus lakei]
MDAPWDHTWPDLADVPALRKANSKLSVPFSKLSFSEKTMETLHLHIDSVGLDCKRFDHSAEGQCTAFKLLSSLGLHIPDEIQRDVRSKYSIRSTDRKEVKGKVKNPHHIYTRCTRIYQCLCGTDHQAGKRPSKDRQIGWENVACISWIKIVSTHDEMDKNSKKMLCIDEITGIFDHTEACESLVQMDRDPRIGLHPEIRTYALSLVKLQVPITQLQQRCREFAKDKFGDAPGNTHHRFILNDHETTSLYCMYFAELGVPQHSAAEENLEKWFRSSKPSPPDSALTDACLYYKHCGEDPSDRFIIIISTPEQREMAWRYGHKKLLLLDGTFGVNSACSLLFIGMVINDAKKGIPVSTTAAHADYDGPLLQDLLGRWKQAMDFDIKVVRNALSIVFPDALLLLCRFHTAQAWRNGGPARQEFLLFEDAISHYNKHLDYFQKLGELPNALSKKNYLRLPGVAEAARHLGVEPEHVPHTTNHLESFNGRIKHRYFRAYQHSGRLPRLDVWILTLILKVIPAFLQELTIKEVRTQYFLDMRHAPPKSRYDSDTSFDFKDDAEFIEVERFDAWVETEWLDDMCDDGAISEEPIEGEEEMDIEALPLTVTGNNLNTTASDEQSLDSTDVFNDSDWHDTALLADSLNSESSAPSTPPSSPIVKPFILEGIEPPPLAQPVTSLAPSINLANQRVTAMQTILAIEDSLVRALRHALSICDDKDDILQRHISPSIHEQLSGAYHPPQIVICSSGSLDNENEPVSPIQPSPTKQTRWLPALPAQKKETRKTSYGIR